MCLDNNKLYAVVEDYRFTNHYRPPFSLGTYTEEDIDFFTKNNIHTFNSGLLMFKNTKNMKNHFQDVLNLRTVFPDGQFTEQPYLNYYFNRHNLVDTNVVVPNKNYYYITDENYNDEVDLSNHFCHFIGNTFSY